MTLAEILREEGFAEGIEKGFEKGESQAYVKMAIKALSKKFGILAAVYREKIAELDLLTLETLNDEIDSFESIDDVKKFLGL